MSFRKRGLVVGGGGSNGHVKERLLTDTRLSLVETLSTGTRPSPVDGRSTTSTGTRSLDSLLAGHAGLVLGNSLLVEETGTTDFSGTLLRYYASEGIVQGHHIHVLGMHEGWARDLPGLSTESSSTQVEEKRVFDEKMKIAWRYERLGEFGAGVRERPQSATSSTPRTEAVFCHDFDLSKRLIVPSSAQLTFVPTSMRQSSDFSDVNPGASPFSNFIHHLASQLSAAPSVIHRVIIPSLLSPALYPPYASRPEHVLQFLHALRALLRQHSTTLTAMITLPLSLYPRSTGLTRWMELLNDGVLELAPFPSSAITPRAAPNASTVQEEPPQGMLKIHRLPVFHEKGGGGGEASGVGNDLAFTLSRRKGLVIKPYSLPPVEGDEEAQQGSIEHDHGKATKVDIAF